VIKQSTVFILGAGASMPYGFPSGAQLRDNICGAANHQSALANLIAGSVGIRVEEIMGFASAFHRSSLLSIDAFLARRPEFTRVGKLCIAAELIKCEVPQFLRRLDNKDHWYALLWEALSRDAASVEDICANEVQFITFNYDRSLEYFLFEAVKNSFGTTDEDALAVVKKLGIIHVYGSLAEFHFAPTGGARSYVNDVTGRTIENAAEGIRVIPEARDGDAVFATARHAIGNCKRLCFLGFGFDSLNLQRLDIPGLLEWRHESTPLIVASALGKTPTECEFYRKRVCGARSRPWETHDWENSVTLRRSGVLL
jgi:hypothetical protein